MSDQQQQGHASTGGPSGMSQRSQATQQGGRQATPGGSNPPGGGQPSQWGGADRQGGAQQSQSGNSDQQGTGLDEEDITESPRRDSSLQQGGGDSTRAGGQPSR